MFIKTIALNSETTALFFLVGHVSYIILYKLITNLVIHLFAKDFFHS